jgi:hypothetical protein
MMELLSTIKETGEEHGNTSTTSGYTEAILSLSSSTQRLAKWEESIYGLIGRFCLID